MRSSPRSPWCSCQSVLPSSARTRAASPVSPSSRYSSPARSSEARAASCTRRRNRGLAGSPAQCRLLERLVGELGSSGEHSRRLDRRGERGSPVAGPRQQLARLSLIPRGVVRVGRQPVGRRGSAKRRPRRSPARRPHAASSCAAAARCRAFRSRLDSVSYATRRRGPAGSRTGRARATAGRPGRRSTSLRTSAAEQRLELRLSRPASARAPSRRERLAEHGRVLDERAAPPGPRPSSRAAIEARAASPGPRARSTAPVGRYTPPSRASRPRSSSMRTVSTA